MTPQTSAPAFVHAAHWTPARRLQVDLVVLHSMEAPEVGDRARQVARWFARPCARADCMCDGPLTVQPGPRASAHYCVDDEEYVQCVSELDVAWAAPSPGTPWSLRK